MRRSRIDTTSLAIHCESCLSVVSLEGAHAAIGTSSKPTIEMSLGTSEASARAPTRRGTSKAVEIVAAEDCLRCRPFRDQLARRLLTARVVQRDRHG